MEEKLIGGSHKIVINNRKTSVLTGVTDVVSFDVKEVLLETTQGALTIKGSNLHVSRLVLEKGEVDLEGKIDSVTYSETKAGGKQGESLFTRMFK